MTPEQRAKCHSIIHVASMASAGIGAGLAQIPGSDNAAIVPIQITMIISLAGVFNIKLSRATAAATLGSATATIAGRGISQILVGWIPFIGNAINASTAFAISESIGWLAVSEFDSQSKSKNK